MKNKQVVYSCYGISFVVYTAILLWGLLTQAIFGFGLLSFYFVVPIISLAGAIILHLFNASLKWLYPFVFATFGLSIPLIMGHMVMFSDVWLLCVIPPFLGTIIGFVIWKTNNKSKKN